MLGRQGTILSGVAIAGTLLLGTTGLVMGQQDQPIVAPPASTAQGGMTGDGMTGGAMMGDGMMNGQGMSEMHTLMQEMHEQHGSGTMVAGEGMTGAMDPGVVQPEQRDVMQEMDTLMQEMQTLMQEMHEQNGSGMMGGQGMMGGMGGQARPGGAESTPAGSTPEDHEQHHPGS